ncbi:MAG: nickel-responsive transcriptional regulator NikR [Bacillota bacterium]|jgi:CopG family nickel-responsive transcriptional regulator
MARLARFSVSMDERLLDRFDRLIGRKGYQNRSEALRDLIRDRLVEEEWSGGEADVVGVVSLLYDHHTKGLVEALTGVQHDYGENVVSAIHVHLDHHNCFEALVVKGRAASIREMADRLGSLRGVKHTRLTFSSSGRDLP